MARLAPDKAESSAARERTTETQRGRTVTKWLGVIGIVVQGNVFRPEGSCSDFNRCCKFPPWKFPSAGMGLTLYTICGFARRIGNRLKAPGGERRYRLRMSNTHHRNCPFAADTCRNRRALLARIRFVGQSQFSERFTCGEGLLRSILPPPPMTTMTSGMMPVSVMVFAGAHRRAIGRGA